MWKNSVDVGRSQMAIWRMCIACWIPKCTNAHTQVVYHSWPFHCNNGWTDEYHCYLI